MCHHIASVAHVLVFLAVRHVGSQFPEQGSNPHSLFGRQSPNHWTTRKSQDSTLLSLKCVASRSQPRSGTHLRWGAAWSPSGRRSAASPGRATAGCAPAPAAPSACAPRSWPSALWWPSSELSWHTAFQHRGHLLYAQETPFRKLKMKRKKSEDY